MGLLLASVPLLVFSAMVKFCSVAVPFLASLGLAWAKCPGSPSHIHAWAEVEVSVDASCDDVKAEMLARVQGQPAAWYDPHNNGTYTVLDQSSDEISLQRVTANKKYTDKFGFDFNLVDGKCSISGCSESQVFSIGDFSTNYCNMRMLYCGSKDGCKPVKNDFSNQETKVSHNIGAGGDASACLKVATEQFLQI